MAENPLPDEPQGVVWAPWRVQVRDRIVRDEEELERTPPERRDKYTADAGVAGRALASARRHARLSAPGESNKSTLSARLERLLLSVFTGAPIDAAWLALHRAEEAMLMLMDGDALRREVVQLQRAFAQLKLPDDDPRTAPYTTVLKSVAESTAGSEVSDPDRSTLRDIRTLVNQASDQVHGNRRALRNVQLAIAGMCAAVTIFLGIADHWWTDGLNLQPAGAAATVTTVAKPSKPAPPRAATPTKPSAPDPNDSPGAGEVLLIAGVGGLLSAIVALRNLDPYSGPYGMSVVQAVLKVPAGALTGYVGVLVMQRGLLGVVGPQDGTRVLGYAALFGFAQLSVTRLLDDQANKVVGQTKAAQDPATTPSPTTTKAS